MKRAIITPATALFIIIICMMFPVQTFSQVPNIEFIKKNFSRDDHDKLKEAVENIENADRLYKLDRRATYLQALPLYKLANDFNPNNALLNYKIGKCLLFSLQKTQAIYYLDKARKLDPKVSRDLGYLLARAYHFNLEIEKAALEYRNFLTSLDADEMAVYGNEVNRKLAECKVAKELMSTPVRVIIENLGEKINTSFPEYNPVITADESFLMYTSSRVNTVGGELDPADLYYYEDIYTSQKNVGIWMESLHPGKPLNSEYHDATNWLSPDGQDLILYRGDNGGDLYESKLKGEDWTEPDAFPRPINSKYHESSAAYTSDMNTLYFVSDRPGGFGGHDIYTSTRDKKGKWSEPRNLGGIINTMYDEISVFLHPDGKTLYFSSDGHNTMGGLDMFKSVLDNGKWSKPENLGYPINKADDDAFLSISGSGIHAYYASFKPDGYGEKDIYMITFLGAERNLFDANEDNLLASVIIPFTVSATPGIEAKTSELTILKGVVLDETTRDPIVATLTIVNNVSNQEVTSTTTNSATGKYLVPLPSGANYGISVQADGYLFHSENVDIPPAKGYQEIIRDIYLKKVEIGKRIVLRNIFYDFDRYTLRPESEAELSRLITLLKQMPRLKIEISGHTDSYGSAPYNQKLSENRAKAVVDYLVGHGIEKERLTFAGYGLTQPIATNKTDEGRQLNRRTEFKILAK
jgi:outer membrane protein OmpA-like peptidoglycan-associated protein/tetratricopeptide (TPR) repeat protein